MQFNGRFSLSNDTLYLIDEYFINDGITTSTKEIAQGLPEDQKNRMLKFIRVDEKHLVLRDLRPQRIWKYHVKEK